MNATKNIKFTNQTKIDAIMFNDVNQQQKHHQAGFKLIEPANVKHNLFLTS